MSKSTTRTLSPLWFIGWVGNLLSANIPQMNRRYAAALASIGWYLMVPQVGRRYPFLLETNKPLSQWETRESFDTAQECKGAQHKIRVYLDAATTQRLKEAGSQHAYVNDPVSQMLWAEEAKIEASKCIASDDPRLKGN
jgi:hypothetical protein